MIPYRAKKREVCSPSSGSKPSRILSKEEVVLRRVWSEATGFIEEPRGLSVPQAHGTLFLIEMLRRFGAKRQEKTNH
jgi:hypothetical protein